MNFNLAKIGILRKNVDLSFKKIVNLFINDIDTLKINYLQTIYKLIYRIFNLNKNILFNLKDI